MEKVNLFWAIVWGLIFALSVVAIFWNPSHFFTAAISAVLCALFIKDYIEEKRRK